MHDLDHFRTWFHHEVKGEFSLRAVETKLNIPTGTLHHFVSGRRNYLGDNEGKIVAWAKCRGYNPETQYDPVI